MSDPAFYVVAVPAVLPAEISKVGFGSGVAFVATPILSPFVSPVAALGVMLPLLVLMDLASLRAYGRLWSWSDAWQLLVSGVPGVLFGALLWRAAPGDFFPVLIGAISVGFVAWQVLGSRVLGATRARKLPISVGILTMRWRASRAL